MLAMPVTTVQKITGLMIMRTSLMKASPSGFIATRIRRQEVAHDHTDNDRHDHLHVQHLIERFALHVSSVFLRQSASLPFCRGIGHTRFG